MTRRFRVLACLALGFLIGSECHGFGGSVYEMPAPTPATAALGPRYAKLSGLSMTLDTRWFDTGGYRPIAVRLAKATPTKSGLPISVELVFGDSDRQETTLSVRQEFVLPAGKSEVEGLILCPTDSPSARLRWTVEIQGTVDPELSVQRRRGINRAARPQQHRGLRVVRPFAKSRIAALLQGSAQPGQANYGARQVGVPVFRSEPLGNWIGYSSADVLKLTRGELRVLAIDAPERLVTVHRWLLAGGTVWIEEVPDTPDGYLEVDSLLEIASWRYEAIEAEREEEEAPVVQAAAQPSNETLAGAPDDGDDTKEVRQLIPVEGAAGWAYRILGGDQDLIDQAAAAIGKPAQTALERLRAAPQHTQGWYATRQVGFGQVLAFKKRYDSVPLMRFGRSESIRSEWRKRAWAPRHGIDPGSACTQFGNLLIPGVGVAPVTEFQFLITLFVLTIGPLNYWLLWRKQQLQMLVVTVPLCALAVTMGLIGYAVVADGFGVKARVRGVTLLNQTTGEAVSWSRMTHYAAMTPDTPPTMPGDCVVYPVRPAWEKALSATGDRRRLVWDEGTQQLTSGWFPSRTAVQHLVIRCRQSPAKVIFAEDASRLSASNQLGVPVALLVVRDTKGNWRQATDLDAGASASPQPVDRLAAVQAYRELALENEPTFPIGAGKAVEETLEKLGNARTVRRMQRNFSAVNLDDNLAEQVLDSISGLSGGRSLNLPPRSYVAVTRQAIETPLGWDEVTEIGSFHVLVGRW